MADEPADWDERTSSAYRDIAAYAVPERERQIEIALALVRAADGNGGLLDLGCGEGLLTRALLDAVPSATVHAYDGSESMLARTRAACAGDLHRLETRQIDLAATGWRRFPQPLRAIASSLAVHHLDDAAKRELFADLYAALAPGGVFVLADVVQPATAVGARVAGDLWDAEVRRRALARDGTLHGYEAFQAADWNHFRHTELDPIDKPARLVDQLDWLRAAGFADLDLHWMTAGQMLLSAWRR